MADTAAPAPAPALRVLHALLALAISSAWLVAAAVPAAAAQDWGVQEPGPGRTIDGPFIIDAYVVSFAEQNIDAVRSRFRRGEQPVGDVRTLAQRGDPQNAGLPGQTRSRWQAPVGVSGLPNGTYTLEVSVVDSLYPSGSPWRGHEVVIDVAPTATLETVRVADAEARTVEVRWVRTSAPDHVRYVVQRATGAGSFTDVHTAVTSDSVVHVDTVPEHGDYRYRVKVVRLGADGGEREAVSEARSVSVQPEAPTRPVSGEEPEVTPGAPSEVDTGGEGTGPGTSVPSLDPGTAPGVSAPSTTSARSQRPNVAPPPNPNSIFEERLDYGVPLPQPQPQVEVAPPDDAVAGAGQVEDGGTLTVFGGGSELTTEQALKPVAGGLVLTLFGLHIVRFLRSAP